MRYILFTTTQCPKCPSMKEFVANGLDFPGETIDETSPEFHQIAQKYNVMNVPTFLFLDEDRELLRAHEPYEVEDFIAANQAA